MPLAKEDELTIFGIKNIFVSDSRNQMEGNNYFIQKIQKVAFSFQRSLSMFLRNKILCFLCFENLTYFQMALFCEAV